MSTNRSEYMKEYRQRNSEKLRAYYRARYRADPKKHIAYSRDKKLRRQYGIDGQAHWEAIFDAQGRKCACCGSTNPHHPGGWVVDHDHNNPKPNYRAILCAPCNIAIGNAKECPARLRSCADYLDRQSVHQNEGEICHGK